MAASDKNNNKIIVYHTASCISIPSPSPFVLKLMTYLRMADINYVAEETLKTSSKGKAPFITYNGKQVEDSAFIIDFLNKELNIDLNAGLSECDKAVSLAFQRLCEENLYWVIVYNRWFVQQDNFFKHFKIAGAERFAMKLYAAVKFKPAQKANLVGHGIGRHTKKEIYEIVHRDLSALSTFLGEKMYFMGENPTEIDCALFGLLAQFVYILIDTEQETLVCQKYSNLKDYCDRMKEKYWPDWNEQCAH